MRKTSPKRIVFIGAGNVATHLAKALYHAGHQIIQVYSQTKASAKHLANMVSSTYKTDLQDINNEGDIYIISIKDDVISKIVQHLKLSNKLVVHTSGSIPIEILKEVSDNYGVFYPLQTFSKEREVDFCNVPVCIEANTKVNEKVLFNLASSLSDNVHLINTKQRKILHLAAVFACNFTNHLYAIAEDILQKEEIPFELLKPLIQETANKIQHKNPKAVQTGPAIRKDEKILKEHVALLVGSIVYKELYELMSKSIINSNINVKN